MSLRNKEMIILKLSYLSYQPIVLTLNAALPSQYYFLQDHNRCINARCALLCKCFLLLTLSKFLSNEFLSSNSLMKKSCKNNYDFQLSVTQHKTQCQSIGVLECNQANPIRWLVPTRGSLLSVPPFNFFFKKQPPPHSPPYPIPLLLLAPTCLLSFLLYESNL